MNYHYHRKTLLATESDHPYVQHAATMLEQVEQAMKDYVEDKITTEQYIDRITPYDQFMWEKAHEKPQKSNPINTGQNKKYSTWREQKWAPVFEKIRRRVEPQWSTSLVVIQNKQVVETVYNDGYIAFKDVDGGLAIESTINNKKVLIPVIAVEDKGGHACSTCFNGVNAQGLRLHQSFPNAKHVFITDNNVSVGANKGMQIADHINLTVLERGTNRVHEEYPKLHASRWQEVLDGITARLTVETPSNYTNCVIIESHGVGTLRSQTDSAGIVWNW